MIPQQELPRRLSRVICEASNGVVHIRVPLWEPLTQCREPIAVCLSLAIIMCSDSFPGLGGLPERRPHHYDVETWYGTKLQSPRTDDSVVLSRHNQVVVSGLSLCRFHTYPIGPIIWVSTA